MNQPNFEFVFKSLGYQFLDLSQLKLALTHSSAHGKINNERLEFLGDSVLGLVIAEYLFLSFGDIDEGRLSRLRAHLVQKKTLALVARDLNLSQYIILGPGELRSGGHERDSILADTLEALIGAIYLESGYEKIKILIKQWFGSRLDSMDVTHAHKDAKSRLQEWLQARKFDPPAYQVDEVMGQGHAQTFIVSCGVEALAINDQARGKSRKDAEQKAAEQVLNQLLKASS